MRAPFPFAFPFPRCSALDPTNDLANLFVVDTDRIGNGKRNGNVNGWSRLESGAR
jgi:hypothetical protein